jgi:hypothetical protein
LGRIHSYFLPQPTTWHGSITLNPVGAKSYF